MDVTLTDGIIELAVRSPHSGEWIRVNPEESSFREVLLIQNKGITYLVDQQDELMKFAAEHAEPTTLFMAQNDKGETFLWPVRCPGAPFPHCLSGDARVGAVSNYALRIL